MLSLQVSYGLTTPLSEMFCELVQPITQQAITAWFPNQSVSYHFLSMYKKKHVVGIFVPKSSIMQDLKLFSDAPSSTRDL